MSNATAATETDAEGWYNINVTEYRPRQIGALGTPNDGRWFVGRLIRTRPEYGYLYEVPSGRWVTEREIAEGAGNRYTELRTYTTFGRARVQARRANAQLQQERGR